MAEKSDSSLNDALVSVVIPFPADPDRAAQVIEKVNRQSWENQETILVAGSEFTPGGSGYANTRLIEEQHCHNMAELVNAGMAAAHGDIRVLLMPNCMPSDNDWLKDLITPFQDPDVDAVVSQCEGHHTRDANLSARLMESVESPEVKHRDTAQENDDTHLLSHLCDAFRASLITKADDFYRTCYPTPGEAVDLSVRILSDNGKILLSPAAKVWYYDPPKTRSLGVVFENAINYGRADALLGKVHNIDWLGSRTYAAAVLSLLTLPIALFSLPIAFVGTLLVFAWCWFLPLRIPVVRWECPISILHIGIYAVIVLSIRGHWAPHIFPPREWHPAIIRQVCFTAALPLSFLLILMYTGIQSAVRTMKDVRGTLYAPAIFALSIVWSCLSGIGYIAGYVMDKPDQAENNT